MKNSRFQYEYRASASKLHRAVGDCLRLSSMKHYEIYQEYPVVRVNKSYDKSSHHFDWVIPRLSIVIECHGKQHYTPVAFDGDYDKAVDGFQALKDRDAAKKEAALAAGFSYVEISYSDIKRIDEQFILDKIKVAQLELTQYDIEHESEIEEEQHGLAEILAEKKKATDKQRRKDFLSSDRHREDLKRARQYQRKRYRQLKELKKNE